MNRLLLTGIGILLWALTGCSNKDEAPAGILPKEKMEAVLWDMIQAERFTSTFVSKDSTKNVQTENFKLYEQLFSIHQVTKDEFIKSYKFYLSRPDIARVMFDSLSTRANRQREELYKSQSQPADSTRQTADSTKRADSIKKSQPAAPDLKADSIRKHLRDSMMANTKRQALKPVKHPLLIPADSNRPPKPLRPVNPARLRIRDSLLRHSQ